MSIEKLFVPYEIAKLAKEKGFSDDCLDYYYSLFRNRDKIILSALGSSGPAEVHECNAPTWDQLREWFRTNHNIYIDIQPCATANKDVTEYSFIIKGINTRSRSSSVYYLDVRPMNHTAGRVGAHSRHRTIKAFRGNFYEAYTAAFKEAFKLIVEPTEFDNPMNNPEGK